jgi:hypothetical protein
MVVVAELVPAVVEWNRGPLASLAGQVEQGCGACPVIRLHRQVV